MIGETISHYKILEKIGAGGMGEVFLTEDTKLHRQVALKFLPPELTRDPEAKKRFEREAQAAAALNHPNIITIHEINEYEDQTYMVMEYVEGQTLKDKIANSPLPVAEAITIVSQVGEGLAKAHHANIIHRDIKPANILVSPDNRAKILDFGIAKLAGGRTRLTRAGSTIGTTSYMSPEQAGGEEVDHRSDIWSLGAVLYEMLTGKLPFPGEYDQAVIYSILNEQPPSLATIRTDIPRELEKIVGTCLQKDPSARYHSMNELLTDLKEFIKDVESKDSVRNPESRTKHTRLQIAWTALAGIFLLGSIVAFVWHFLMAPGQRILQIPVKRLVVLPFENLGPSENQYFADGITDELITRLSSLIGLGVISRSSAMQYARTTKTIGQIGKELSVEYALEGAVRWAQDHAGRSRIRITPTLTRVSDKITLWGETYDRVMDDIFQVQSEISQKVIEKLEITLLEPERKTVEKKPPTKNLGAYQAFLRARYYENRPHFTAENWMRVVEGYEQAVQLDPGFALAFAELARAHARIYYNWYDHSQNRLDRAIQASEQAMALGPELPGVHLALGYYYLYAYRDPQKALREFSIAERGIPHHVDIFQAKAAVAMLQGRWDEARENNQKALEISPRDASVAVALAEIYWVLRRYEEAFRTCNLAIELTPNDSWPYLSKIFTLWSWKGAFKETRTIIPAVPQNHEWVPWVWFWQDMFEKRYREAVERLFSTPDAWIRTKCWAMPKSLLAAFACKLSGDNEQSRRYYEQAKSLLEAEVKKWPEDPRFHSSLGIANASLGLKKEALQEGNKAVELLTVSRDAFYGMAYVEDLAFILTIIGENDEAIDKLEYLLTVPSWISVPFLRMDPQWNALRSHPRFIKLLEKHSKEN